MRIRYLLLALLTATLAATSLAQTGSYSLKFTLSARNFADTIAIDVVDGRVVVPVVVGGKTLRFMLDTGAAQAIVYDDTPIEGTTPAGTIRSLDAVGQERPVPLVVLPPLKLGSVTFTGLQATVYPRPEGAGRIDGIAGFDLICKGLGLKIDTRRRHIVLTDRKKHFDGEAGLESKYSVKAYRHTPYVRLSPFKHYKEEALFDTGSRQLYAISRESFDKAYPYLWAQRRQQIEGRAEASYHVGLNGREASSEVVFLRVDSLDWAGFAFRDYHTKTTQGGSHLGAGVLEYGAITFLTGRHTLRFQPYDGLKSVAVDNPQEEKVIANVGGRPVVTFVWQQGRSFKAGLRQGDILLKVDGKELSDYDEFARFRYLIGLTYTFLVRDVRGINKEVRMEW